MYSDWWAWEKTAGLKEVSAQACRHYERFKEDFALAKLLHHNCHRLSIEWSRIEPEEGAFSSREMAHYGEVIRSLRELAIEPVVTLHHFTNPAWFASLGGWSERKSCDYFLRYAAKIIDALADRVRYWVTINEPMVYVYYAYILGTWPPQEKSLLKAREAAKNLLRAHVACYRLIHETYRKKELPLPLVSVAQNIQYFFPCVASFPNKVASFLRDKAFNAAFIEKALKYKSLDFIGVNYYTRNLVHVRGLGLKHLLLDGCDGSHNQHSKNCLGWDIYPEGLYKVLMGLRKYRLPLFILENGICTQDDNQRWDFIRSHLVSLSSAIAQGVKVLGYMYWSLMDNYEWDKGFGPRFGLIDIDYTTYARTIRESAKKFALVCKANSI